MGAFNINITGVGGHGCERKAKAGERLYGRCGRFTCPDCMAYEFVQRMKQAGMVREGDSAYSVEVPLDDPATVEYLQHKQDAVAADALETPRVPELPPYRGPIFEMDGKFWRMVPMHALFTHWPNSSTQVVDDMLTNERKAGSF